MKNKIRLALILVAFAFISLSSCHKESSDDVNQSRIFTSYELYYNADEDITHARASFRFGNITGTLLELSAPSEVRFNNQLLSFNSTLAYYEKSYAGFVQSGTFTWKNTEGTVFNNTIEIHSVDYPALLDTIYRDASLEFIWQGDSLGANEVLTLSISNDLGEAQLFSQATINSKSIILPLNKLQLLEEGEAKIWMDRKYSPPLVEKTSAGGTITSRYRPVNRTVYLK
ncbi:MAG: hypothetical protein RBS19_11405 [Bacteroidales bacterium]|nr:hypothetical protein [Bacteroidales bacterium]MDY0217550.1 hypothetical protein [Bacteroidales bacterium]